MRHALFTALFLTLAATAAVAAPADGGWSAPQKVDEVTGNLQINTPSLEAARSVARRLAASSWRRTARAERPASISGSPGGTASDEPFGAPENLPAPIDSAADDFCPTPLRCERLLFISRAASPPRPAGWATST